MRKAIGGLLIASIIPLGVGYLQEKKTPQRGIVGPHRAFLKAGQDALIAVSPPSVVSFEVKELVEAIILAESRGNPEAKNPNSTAYGLCQFLDSTWKYVKEKWDMELERENPIDQRYACRRLLQEEGTIHWKASGF